MRPGENKGSRGNVIRRLVLYGALLVLGVCVVFLPGYSELHKLRDKNGQLRSRIRLLEEHNDKLKEELLKMKEDPVFVEKKAREKLGIVRKGEVIYRGK